MEPNHPKTAKLHNKLFKVIVTVGAGKEEYPEERVLTDMGSEIAMYTGMKCETPFVFYEDDTEEKNKINQFLSELITTKL